MRWAQVVVLGGSRVPALNFAKHPGHFHHANQLEEAEYLDNLILRITVPKPAERNARDGVDNKP